MHNITFDFAFWDKFNWNVDVRRNLKTYDPAATRLKDYTVVDMAFNYAINKDVKAYLKPRGEGDAFATRSGQGAGAAG